MRLALGCWSFGGNLWDQDYKDSIKTIHWAIRNNIRHFDSAQNYGKGISEQIVSQQLRRFSNQINRKEFTIATKILLPPSASQIPSLVNKSLKRMNTSSIDLLYIHWPSSKKEINPYLVELEKLKKENVIGSIGVSNFPLKLLKEASEVTKIDYSQFHHSLLYSRPYFKQKEFCIDNNIKTVSYSPLAVGLLGGKYKKVEDLKENDWRKMLFPFESRYNTSFNELLDLVDEIATKNGVDNATIALSWVLRHQIDIVLSGSRTKEQLEKTINSYNFVLNDDDFKSLNSASASFNALLDEDVDNFFFHKW
jgi:myo-inositol catabolism protein IolS